MTEDDKTLVERLRKEADEWDEPKSHDEFDMRGMLHSAADRIKDLIAEKEAARKEERAAIVAMMWKDVQCDWMAEYHADILRDLMDRIQAGEHLK